MAVCLLVFHVLAMSRVILGRVPIWDVTAHEWRLYRAVELEGQVASTMTQYPIQ